MFFQFLNNNKISNCLLFDKYDDIQKGVLEKFDLENLNRNSFELSQGEKQRLALINTLSQNSEMLILDEITSSVDVQTEELINKILFELKGKKTIISIAHRLNILKHC